MNEIQLDDSERTPCEVWTRVMGYHRPVSAFNAGKLAEHKERLYFREERCSGEAVSLSDNLTSEKVRGEPPLKELQDEKYQAAFLKLTTPNVPE